MVILSADGGQKKFMMVIQNYDYCSPICTITIDNMVNQQSTSTTYHKKNGSQQAKNADMMMPKVLAAFRSRFILLVVAKGLSCSAAPTSMPAAMPLICRCLFSNAVATLLLQKNKIN